MNINELRPKIGRYFFDKNERNYQATLREVERLQIVDVYEGKEGNEAGKLVIELGRPGLLIGRRGEQVDELKDFLGVPIFIKEAMHLLIYEKISRKPVALAAG